MSLSFDVNKARAVLIGVSSFLDKASFYDIPPIKNNLSDFSRLLSDNQLIGIPQSNISIHLDIRNDEIDSIINDALSNKNIETLILYYAGHGHYEAGIGKDTVYLTGVNSSIKTITTTGYNLDNLKSKLEHPSIIKNIPQKIVILDCCHSGAMAMNNAKKIDFEYKIKGTYILTSSHKLSASRFEEKDKHTKFTEKFINLIEEGIDNHQEYLSLNELFEELYKLLVNNNLPDPQKKDGLNVSDFFFCKNKTFNFNALIQKADDLFYQAKFSEAKLLFQQLHNQFPSNSDYKDKIVECQKKIDYANLVIEADQLFYSDKNYPKALAKYKQAQKLNNDSTLQFKISQCENHLQNKFLEPENDKNPKDLLSNEDIWTGLALFIEFIRGGISAVFILYIPISSSIIIVFFIITSLYPIYLSIKYPIKNQGFKENIIPNFLKLAFIFFASNIFVSTLLYFILIDFDIRPREIHESGYASDMAYFRHICYLYFILSLIPIHFLIAYFIIKNGSEK
jgi:tetratricopeptide (TPR) repeat protein